MAFNGSGTFIRVRNWVQDAAAGIKIRADRHDTEDDNFAAGLSQCITKDGQTTITANLPMAGYKHTNVAAASSATDYAQFGQVATGKIAWADAGGTADAITASYSLPFTALVDGMMCCFRASAANTTTTPTFSPDVFTARTIVRDGGGALVAGDIAGDGFEAILRYDLTNTRWELLNPAKLSAGAPQWTSSGLVGIGGGTSSSVGLNINSSGMTGTAQYGAYLSPLFESDCTTFAASFLSAPRTENASFTTSALNGFYAGNMTKGASHTVTNQYGFYCAALSGATNNWGFYGAGTSTPNYLGSDLRMGTTTSITGASNVAGHNISASGVHYAEAVSNPMLVGNRMTTDGLIAAFYRQGVYRGGINVTTTTCTADMDNALKYKINFNGTGTPAARTSFNISSITDNGTGNYTLNFTNSVPADTVPVGSAALDNNGGTFGRLNRVSFTDIGTTSIKVLVTDEGSSAEDAALITVMGA